MENKGTLLTFISEYKEKSQEQEYYVEGTNSSYIGRQTNDAPTKYLLDCAKEDGIEIEHFICIVTDKSMEKVNGESGYSNFVRNILKYYQADNIEDIEIKNDFSSESFPINNKTIVVDKIHYDNSISKTETRILELYNSFSLKTKNDEEFYIDCTGGMRDINFLVLSIVRYLEYSGKKSNKSVYAEYLTKQLHPMEQIYEMFSIINAVDEFVTTGRVNKLNELSKKHINTSEEIQKLINSLKKFSEHMEISRISQFQSNVEEIRQCLEECKLVAFENDIFGGMVKGLIKSIEERMPLDDNNTILDWVEWCVKNGLLQQAVTLYKEKIFDDYNNNKNIRKIIENKNSLLLECAKRKKMKTVEKNIEKSSLQSVYFESLLPIREQCNGYLKLKNEFGKDKKRIPHYEILDFFDIENEKELEEKILSTENKKKNVVKKVYFSQGELNDRKTIKELFERYVVIKEIRNCMNHASEIKDNLTDINAKLNTNISIEYNCIKKYLCETIRINKAYYEKCKKEGDIVLNDKLVLLRIELEEKENNSYKKDNRKSNNYKKINKDSRKKNNKRNHSNKHKNNALMESVGDAINRSGWKS